MKLHQRVKTPRTPQQQSKRTVKKRNIKKQHKATIITTTIKKNRFNNNTSQTSLNQPITPSKQLKFQSNIQSLTASCLQLLTSTKQQDVTKKNSNFISSTLLNPLFSTIPSNHNNLYFNTIIRSYHSSTDHGFNSDAIAKEEKRKQKLYNTNTPFLEVFEHTIPLSELASQVADEFDARDGLYSDNTSPQAPTTNTTHDISPSSSQKSSHQQQQQQQQIQQQEQFDESPLPHEDEVAYRKRLIVTTIRNEEIRYDESIPDHLTKKDVTVYNKLIHSLDAESRVLVDNDGDGIGDYLDMGDAHVDMEKILEKYGNLGQQINPDAPTLQVSARPQRIQHGAHVQEKLHNHPIYPVDSRDEVISFGNESDNKIQKY